MTGPRTDAALRKRIGVLATAVALATGLVPAPLRAESAPPRRWLALALSAGTAQSDARMADYQWDVRPHPAWDATLLAGRGRLATGIRVAAGHTTQTLGLPGFEDARVSQWRVEWVGRATLVTRRSVGLVASASAGRLALAWHPDHVTVDAGGTPVEVSLDPIATFTAGAGLGLEGPLPSGWSWGLGMERRGYALDAAHRSGAQVVTGRESLADWDARVTLTHAWDW